LWCANGFGHAVENHNALAAAARRERLVRRTDAAVDVLPIVDRPDITRRIDGYIGLQLQAARIRQAGGEI
jgi:hypothetical protein